MVEEQSTLIPVDWTYYGCNNEDQTRIARYWRTHSARLLAKAAEMTDAASQLNIVAERDTTNEAWRMQAALYAPGATVVAEVHANGPEEAVEGLVVALSREIDRQQERNTTVVRHRSGVEGLEAVLASLHKQDRSEAFMRLLFPLIASVGPYIRRELQVREINGDLAGASVIPADVMDEILLQAWGEFGSRDTKRDIDLWLVELADQVLDRLQKSTAEVSLDDRVPVPSPNSRNARQDEWVEQVSYFDRVELARLLEAERSIDAWDDGQLEKTQRHLAELLGDMRYDERQALVLSAGLGFSSADIADFQNRPQEEVQSEIDSAAKQLRGDGRFEYLRAIEEKLAKEDLHQQRKRHSAQR